MSYEKDEEMRKKGESNGNSAGNNLVRARLNNDCTGVIESQTFPVLTVSRVNAGNCGHNQKDCWRTHAFTRLAGLAKPSGLWETGA